MRRITATLFLLGLLAPAVAACGDDRVERGLTPPDEVATPMDPAKMKETEKERDPED